MSDNILLENILKLLEPQKITFSESELKQYIIDSGEALAEIVKDTFPQKSGTAYTLFYPENQKFIAGEWAKYSPSFFWGFKIDDQKKIVFSSFLYYKIWEDVPPYTILWNEQLSSVIPLNIQVINTNNSERFNIEVDSANKIINIYFNDAVYSELSLFLTTWFEVLNGSSIQLDELNNKIEMKEYENGMFCFNFRAVKDAAQVLISPDIDVLTNIAKELKLALGRNLENYKETITEKLTDYDKAIDNLSKVLIKLLLIGPSSTKALRLLNPKQYKLENKYIGCFAGILRIYDDFKMEQLMSLYPLALSLVSNIAFRITTSFMYDFLEKEQKKRYVITDRLIKLLSDFQHIMLKSILGSLELLIKKDSDLKMSSEKIFDYFDRRRAFISKLAKFLTEDSKESEEKRAYNFQEIKKTYLFINDSYFNKSIMTIDDIKKKWGETIQIEGDGSFDAYQGVVDCILENIIFNSITKGFVEDKNYKIYIYIANGSLIVWDTGVGFSENDYKSIKRWIDEGPNEEEKRNNKGYGYWLTKRCTDYNGGDLKYVVFSNDRSISYKDENIPFLIDNFLIGKINTENLGNGRYRVIHFFLKEKS